MRAASSCRPTSRAPGAGDWPALVLGQDQHDLLAEGCPELTEEVPGQVGVAPFAVAGRDVEAVEGVPVPRLDVVAAAPDDRQAAGPGLAALLADRLALARGQGAEEAVEVLVAAVVPAVLQAAPLQHPEIAQERPLPLGREGDVRRGDLELPRQLFPRALGSAGVAGNPIYRPLELDPREARRRLAATGKTMGRPGGR